MGVTSTEPLWGFRIADCGDRTPLNKDLAPYVLKNTTQISPKELSMIAWNLVRTCMKTNSNSNMAKRHGLNRLALSIPGMERLQPLLPNWETPLEINTFRVFSLEIQFTPFTSPASQSSTYTFHMLEPAEVKRLHGIQTYRESCSAFMCKCGAGCINGLKWCVDCSMAARRKKAQRRAARITASLTSLSTTIRVIPKEKKDSDNECEKKCEVFSETETPCAHSRYMVSSPSTDSNDVVIPMTPPKQRAFDTTTW